MVKIHILGGPGSGKTTLGMELAAKFQVPHYDLDRHGPKNGISHAAWVVDTVSIAQQPGWVVENIGIIFIDPLLGEAVASTRSDGLRNPGDHPFGDAKAGAAIR